MMRGGKTGDIATLLRTPQKSRTVARKRIRRADLFAQLNCIHKAKRRRAL